jgi:hypothetical protein
MNRKLMSRHAVIALTLGLTVAAHGRADVVYAQLVELFTAVTLATSGAEPQPISGAWS